MQSVGEDNEVYSVRPVVGEKCFARHSVTSAPCEPESDSIKAVQIADGRLPVNPEFSFDVFEPSAHGKPSCPETEIKVQRRKAERRECRLEIGDIEDRSEKGDEQIALIEFSLYALGRQVFVPHQADGRAVTMQSNNRHIAQSRR